MRSTIKISTFVLLLITGLCTLQVSAQETLTVHDGTTEGTRVPVRGLHANYYLKAEFVISANDLVVMAGGNIIGMKFYATQDNRTWGNAQFQVFLKEVNSESISGFEGTDNATIVYEGSLSVANYEMVVTFSTGYTYTGGNLLIGFYKSDNDGNSSYTTWVGETVESASVSGHSSFEFAIISPDQVNFIPKTTFTYFPSVNTCPDAVDHDGNTYPSVRLGSARKCWTTTNLRSTKYSDGREIKNVMSYYSHEHPNTTENVGIFGHLYNWYAVVDTGRYGSVDSVESAYNMGHRIQGICPDGWYLPSDEEYEELNIYPTTALRSTRYWINGAENTNSTSFNSLPGGKYSCANGKYENIMGNAHYWTCHPVYDMATGAMIDFICEKIVVSPNSRCNGYSVRCVYDEGGSSAATLPTVTTAAVTNVTAITATCGGEVTADGGAPATARGVCWSISPNPTINDSLTTNGSDIGRFTSSLTRLIPGTTYYVRAYATNSVGTAYGNEVSFTAQNGPCPLQATVSDNDGHTYNTVLIGNQCWMKENLRTTKYANGDDIPAENYHNYNTSSISLEQRGLLYNWTAVMNCASSSNANPSGIQGICPTGWHVPSDAEWTQLTDYVSSQNEYTCSNNSEYIAKALASPTGWNPSETTCAVGYSQGNNDATGFSALPAGFWSESHSFNNAYSESNFWSSTQYDGFRTAAYTRYLDSKKAGVVRDFYLKTSAFSVRCIRDIVIDENSCSEAKTVTDKEGNVYATVKIGNQCWMRENMRTKKYEDGTDIIAGGNNTDVTEGYYYDVTSTGIALMQRGYHYNWPAANLICPHGWHLPSDAEWNTMEQTLSGSDWQDEYKTSIGFRGSHAGKLALAGGNESGFSAVPAGACVGLFSSTSLGYDAYFWSSTQGNSDGACSRALDHNRAGVERSYYGKFNGFSVRCVKNVVVVDEKSCTEAQTVTDHEGNVYATVKIGNQCWMRDNLRTTTSPSTGTYLIPAAGTDATLTGKQAHWYNNDSVQYAPQNYGLLYNWNAAMDTFNTVLGETSVDKTSDNAISMTFTGHRRGICPNGWHVPSQSEWNVLTNSVSSINEYICDHNSYNIAKALADTSVWQYSSSICAPGNIPTENNKTGFSILPVSLINAYNNHGQFGSSAYFWSATEAGNYSNAYCFYLIFNRTQLYHNGYHKGYGFSVRCVRD